MQLSKHFDRLEIERSTTASRNNIDNTMPEIVLNNYIYLCENVLEPIRKKFGAVIITSGFRCPVLNKLVGGVNNSQHLGGLDKSDTGSAAVDFYCLNTELDKVWNWLDNINFDQAGLNIKQGFIHISSNAEYEHRNQKFYY